jgi:hypothetical protein
MPLRPGWKLLKSKKNRGGPRQFPGPGPNVSTSPEGAREAGGPRPAACDSVGERDSRSQSNGADPKVSAMPQQHEPSGMSSAVVGPRISSRAKIAGAAGAAAFEWPRQDRRAARMGYAGVERRNPKRHFSSSPAMPQRKAS